MLLAAAAVFFFFENYVLHKDRCLRIQDFSDQVKDRLNVTKLNVEHAHVAPCGVKEKRASRETTQKERKGDKE